MLRKPVISLAVGAVLGIIVLAGCHIPGGVSSSSGSSGTTPTTATGMLNNLGVSAVNSPPPATVTTATGSTMTIDPSTWQPLKTKYAAFAPQAEIFEAGGSQDGAGTNWSTFYQNGSATPAYGATYPFIPGSDQSWEKSAAKVSVAADLTGDGLDNIVVFYVNNSAPGQLNDIVYTPTPSGASTSGWSAPQVVSGVSLITTSGETVFDHQLGTPRGIGTPWFPFFSCTKADLNGDGKDEILLVDYDRLYVLSFDSSSGAFTLPNGGYTTPKTGYPISSVAAGDYNGSGRDDVAVGLYPDYYYLYDSHFNSPASGSVPLGEKDSPVEVTFGDFAGNGLDELAMCLQSTTSLSGSPGQVQVIMYNISASGAMSQATNFLETTNPFPSGSGDYRMLPRAINIGGTVGTGTDIGKGRTAAALFVLSSIYEDPLNITAGSTPTQSYRIGPAISGNTTVCAPKYNNDNTIVDVEVGDTGTGGLPKGVVNPGQDLVVLSVGGGGISGGYNVPDINIYGLNGSGAFVLKDSILPGTDLNVVRSIDNFGTSTTIAVGNFENNCPRVEYVGHTLTFTNPVVIAALASPPYWSDIVKADAGYANAYSGWNTTFGETQAHSTDKSTKVAFSVGAEVKYEEDVNIFGIEAASFEASASFTNTNTWEWDNTQGVSKSIQYNCPGGENLVIFTAVPMDQYQYKVVATTDANTPVGSSLYIVIPRAYNTYVVTQAYYNSHVDTSIVQAISNSVFGTSNFTIGDPTTYPSPTLEQSLMSSAFAAIGWLSSYVPDYQYAEKPVAEGTDNITGGSTNLQITNTTGQSETISHDFETDTSVGGGAGGLSVLMNAGFQTGYSTTSTSETSTTFGGTIGYLPESYYANPNYRYSAGLFVYPYAQPNGTTFWVVDYDVTMG